MKNVNVSGFGKLIAFLRFSYVILKRGGRKEEGRVLRDLHGSTPGLLRGALLNGPLFGPESTVFARVYKVFFHLCGPSGYEDEGPGSVRS